MKNRFSIISTIAAGLSLVPFLRSKNRDIITLLWLPKLLAGATALWLAFIGVISAIYGWMRRDQRLTMTGMVGAALSMLFIRRVTVGHAGFEKTFGEDWKQKIPPAQRTRMQPVRWPVLNIPIQRIPYQKDVLFGTSPATGKPLLADLWLPPRQNEASGLSVIYIHGGSWRLGSKDVGTRTIFQRLANLGHVVMDIDYTLYPESLMIDMVREVKMAVAWLKENHRALGINPERVVLMGGSAGAHLALLAGYTPDSKELGVEGLYPDLSVRGVVAYYPPADFRNLVNDLRSFNIQRSSGHSHVKFQDTVVRFMNDTLRIASSIRDPNAGPRQTREQAGMFTDPMKYFNQLIGGPIDEIPEQYALVSPAAHVSPDCPPTLLLQGTDDFFQLLPGVQRLYHSLQAAGVPAILVEFPHCEHAFDLILPQVSPAAQASTYDVEHFLAMLT